MSTHLTDVQCFDEQRRAAVRLHPTLNGIDFVEYFEDREAEPPQYLLVVTFLKSAPGGLVDSPEQFRIEGGTRIVGIEATDVQPGSEPEQLEVNVSGPGDFSIYTLAIHSPDLDPRLAAAPFSFKAGCPTEFDCQQDVACPPEVLDEPILDYLTKDYASFRQLLLDLIAQRNPRWLERNPAALGMALVELLAYAGDQLSYFQDAVANEWSLDTCRHRVSAKRHARLVDYRMHDGRNAWGFVRLQVNSPGTVPRGSTLLTRINRPLPGQPAPPETVIQANDLPSDFAADPALRRVTVFETTVETAVQPDHHELLIHTWSNDECCLPIGATGATLYCVSQSEAGSQALRPLLQAGDYLLFEEVRGPVTGLEADADPTHRQVVRLESVEPLTDQLYLEELSGEALQPVETGDQADLPALPLLHVTWREADALTFPLCISTRRPETGAAFRNVSIARGNVIPCDQGRTIREVLPLSAAHGEAGNAIELPLSESPITFQAMPVGEPAFNLDAHPVVDRHHLDVSPRDVQPAVALVIDFPPDETEIWNPVPHLLDSNPLSPHFVVDIGNDDRAILRFGDDDYGRQPIGASGIIAIYRIGNGLSGNLGRDALVHIVQPEGVGNWPDIEAIAQPLPAESGTEPETIEEVRQIAPRAFHAEQFRAVTEADYEQAAMRLSEVAAAKATFRYTGSWHTVFVAVHPRNPMDLVTEPSGRIRLSDALSQTVRAHLRRFKLAGYDLELRTARYVPLEIDIQICIAPGHFRGDVLEAVNRALSNRQFADGSAGFFEPSQFTFGQPVYLSQIYAAVERVEGVDSAVVTLFKRYWEIATTELEDGVMAMGTADIARLDNDPNFPEFGVLRLTAIGGQ